MILRRIIAHFRKQEWTAIAIDFVIVVAGILIALEISNWNEARQDRLAEREYLTRIAAELDESIASIERGIELTKERMDFGEFLMRSVDHPEIVRAEPGKFVAAMVQGGYTYSPSVRGHTFEEIKSAGELGLLRDEDLRFDLTEFYTTVKGTEQWNYLRELYQTEYVRRSAGILTYEQIVGATIIGVLPVVAPEDALAARERMLLRADFLAWLPGVTDRNDALIDYSRWLETARDLRARIRARLGAGAVTSP